MIIDKPIALTEGPITIRTITEADKYAFADIVLGRDIMKPFAKNNETVANSIRDIVWEDRQISDSISFLIVENDSKAEIGICEIHRLESSEPLISITIDDSYHNKGYGYLASKMMLEECWKIFDNPFFVWEVEKENIPSKRLAVKLGGKLTETFCTRQKDTPEVAQKSELEASSEGLTKTIEKYVIERPPLPARK